MIERAPYGIIETDEKGIMVHANLEANEILGTTTDELIGFDLNSFVDRSSPSVISEVIKDNRTASLSRVQRFTKKNGNRIWVNRLSPHISDERGSDAYVLEMIQDVTGSKESTIQLARRAEELEVLYDVSKQVIESGSASDSLDSICSVAVDRLEASSALVFLMGVSGNLEMVAKKGAAPDPGINPIVSDTNGEQVRTVDQIDGV